MTQQWKPAPVKRIKEAAEELKGLIRARYPDAKFQLSRASDDRWTWNLWTLVERDDPDEVNDLVRVREQEMLLEENIPLYVVPTLARERFVRDLPAEMR